MKRTHSSQQPNEQVRQEAAAWFVTLSDGPVEETDQRDFSLWLRRSPEHVRAYLRLMTFWEDEELLTRTRKLNADELVQLALRESNVISLDGQGEAARQTTSMPADASMKKYPTRRKQFQMAAAIVLLSVATAVGVRFYSAPTYVTQVGEQRTVALSDGSIVTLNAGSELSVRYSKKERAVELSKGEALFRVAKDSGRPFIVRSGITSIRAVGTQFDVYRKSTEILVSVVEGRVDVSRSSESAPGAPDSGDPKPLPGAERQGAAIPPIQHRALLSAGQQVVVTPTSIVAPSHVDVPAATAWLEGKLVFEDRPLIEVAEEFNRHNPRKLVLDEDAELRAVRISGIFSCTDSAQFVQFLRQRMSLEVQDSDAETRISRRQGTQIIH